MGGKETSDFLSFFWNIAIIAYYLLGEYLLVFDHNLSSRPFVYQFLYIDQ